VSDDFSKGQCCFTIEQRTPKAPEYQACAILFASIPGRKPPYYIVSRGGNSMLLIGIMRPSFSVSDDDQNWQVVQFKARIFNNRKPFQHSLLFAYPLSDQQVRFRLTTDTASSTERKLTSSKFIVTLMAVRDRHVEILSRTRREKCSLTVAHKVPRRLLSTKHSQRT
jgi:hypothetical protein